MNFIPKCPLPLLQLKGSERKKLHGTNTLLAVSRDQKRVEITVKAFLSVKKLFFMKKFIFFWKSPKMYRSKKKLKINQNVGIFPKVFQSTPCLMDGFNFNAWRDLGFPKMRLVVKVFLYENHRQTPTVAFKTWTVNGWHFCKNTNQTKDIHFWT